MFVLGLERVIIIQYLSYCHLACLFLISISNYYWNNSSIKVHFWIQSSSCFTCHNVLYRNLHPLLQDFIYYIDKSCVSELVSKRKQLIYTYLQYVYALVQSDILLKLRVIYCAWSFLAQKEEDNVVDLFEIYGTIFWYQENYCLQPDENKQRSSGGPRYKTVFLFLWS